LKILVCVRAVPAAESDFRVNAAGNAYDDSGLKFKVNDYDLCAVEEAVRIRERLAGARVTIVSVGPARVEEQIRKAMGLGADFGARIDDDSGPARDALSLAGLVAQWARPQGFDLILCGVMSDDLQRCQVGPMLAQLLKIPCATTIISASISPDRKKILCERELEQGVREKVELPLPALLTVQTGINIPRYPSLSNVLRVKKIRIPSVPAAGPDKIPSSEIVRKAYLPERAGSCEFLTGDADEVSELLLARIRARVNVI